MLEVNPETICRLIDLAREFHGQGEVLIADEPENPTVEWPIETLAAYAEDPILEEFRSVLEGLPPDQQQQVVAVQWLGRGDYDLDQWDEAVAYAEECWTETTADYLIAHPLLADYLSEGLDLLGYSCEAG